MSTIPDEVLDGATLAGPTAATHDPVFGMRADPATARFVHSRRSRGGLLLRWMQGATGLRIAMLTGDNETTARAVARQLEIDEVHAGVTPERKHDVIAALQAQRHVVAKEQVKQPIDLRCWRNIGMVMIRSVVGPGADISRSSRCNLEPAKVGTLQEG